MKILLKTYNHLGDTVCLTAALRNAKAAYSDFTFGYQGNYADVFLNNPDLDVLDESDADLVVEIGYRAFPQRFPTGGNLCERQSLALAIELSRFTGRIFDVEIKRPVIFLSEEEMNDRPDIGRYCVLNANCQKCSEVKGYPHWQQVVDARRDVTFVQVGGNEARDISMNLRNVVDARGRTSIRKLFSLVRNASSVLSPSSAVVHIAAAFPEVKAFCLTGAREPTALTAYPNVTHFHTVCSDYCETHGCMKFNLNINTKMCQRPISVDGRKFARCMFDISPKEVASCLQ